MTRPCSHSAGLEPQPRMMTRISHPSAICSKSTIWIHWYRKTHRGQATSGNTFHCTSSPHPAKARVAKKSQRGTSTMRMYRTNESQSARETPNSGRGELSTFSTSSLKRCRPCCFTGTVIGSIRAERELIDRLACFVNTFFLVDARKGSLGSVYRRHAGPGHCVCCTTWQFCSSCIRLDHCVITRTVALTYFFATSLLPGQKGHGKPHKNDSCIHQIGESQRYTESFVMYSPGLLPHVFEVCS